jgi:alanine-glyoxylate transaminase/serine-glyoxylate transaminase/serine-pyruvate transaminase
MEYKMDAWGIDVTIAGSQKGLMLPTGLAMTGVSSKAMEAARKAKLPKYYFNWELMASRKPQRFNGTVPVHFFFGLQESIKLIEEETLEGVFARHARLAEATPKPLAPACERGVPMARARRCSARPKTVSPTR